MTKAIVIDDDIDTVDVFCEYLEIQEVTVIGKGYNGKDAVELYQKFRPDIVFLDSMMPDYDGCYALEKIMQIDRKSKVVMVTADMTADTEQKLTELNATAIVYKPFDINRIMEVIGKLVEGEKLLC